MPLADAIVHAKAGVSILAPEIVLLTFSLTLFKNLLKL
jgi:hypothetical protein